MIEVPRRRDVVARIRREIELEQRCGGRHGVLDRKCFVLPQAGSEKREQRCPLAIAVRVDQRLVQLNRWSLNRTCRRAQLRTQIRSLEIPRDALNREEVKRLVGFEGTAEGAAELFAVKLLETGPIRELA